MAGAKVASRTALNGVRRLERPVAPAFNTPVPEFLSSDDMGVPIKAGTKRWPHNPPKLVRTRNNQATSPTVIDLDHFEPLGSWSHEKLLKSSADNPFLLTWAPSSSRQNIPHLSHGEGVYLVDYHGRKYLDWTSQAVCANLGHDLPESVVQAATHQMRSLPFLYGGLGIQEIRTRLNQLMGEILPSNLQAAVFPSSGAEANEAGIMMARRYTGRNKILSFYRSYHGATANAASTTGDFRRWYGRERSSGFVKAFNPFPIFWEYSGNTEAERTDMALSMLEETILNEGPDDIASIMMESVVGAGGCLMYPPGYMQGVRALCDKYGILLHCDEVMVGFGRTGHMWGFQNYDGVLPDIISAAKGISASSVPLSMTACTQDIMNFFQDKPLGWGSTYQAHGVAMACAYENIKYLIREDIVGHVQRLAPVFKENMKKLADHHDSIKQYRAVGLFGCMDVHQTTGDNPKLQHKPADEAFAKYKDAYAANGLIGLHRYPHIHVAPPLVVTEDQLLDGFDRHDNALYTLDASLGYDIFDNRSCMGDNVAAG